mgnify:CR=1 FL=1
MPKKNYKLKNRDELETILSNYIKETMNLRFQKSMGQLEKPSRIKAVRKEIAKIKTQLNMIKENN